MTTQSIASSDQSQPTIIPTAQVVIIDPKILNRHFCSLAMNAWKTFPTQSDTSAKAAFVAKMIFYVIGDFFRGITYLLHITNGSFTRTITEYKVWKTCQKAVHAYTLNQVLTNAKAARHFKENEYSEAVDALFTYYCDSCKSAEETSKQAASRFTYAPTPDDSLSILIAAIKCKLQNEPNIKPYEDEARSMCDGPNFTFDNIFEKFTTIKDGTPGFNHIIPIPDQAMIEVAHLEAVKSFNSSFNEYIRAIQNINFDNEGNLDFKTLNSAYKQHIKAYTKANELGLSINQLGLNEWSKKMIYAIKYAINRIKDANQLDQLTQQFNTMFDGNAQKSLALVLGEAKAQAIARIQAEHEQITFKLINDLLTEISKNMQFAKNLFEAKSHLDELNSLNSKKTESVNKRTNLWETRENQGVAVEQAQSTVKEAEQNITAAQQKLKRQSENIQTAQNQLKNRAKFECNVSNNESIEALVNQAVDRLNEAKKALDDAQNKLSETKQELATVEATIKDCDIKIAALREKLVRLKIINKSDSFDTDSIAKTIYSLATNNLKELMTAYNDYIQLCENNKIKVTARISDNYEKLCKKFILINDSINQLNTIDQASSSNPDEGSSNPGEGSVIIAPIPSRAPSSSDSLPAEPILRLSEISSPATTSPSATPNNEESSSLTELPAVLLTAGSSAAALPAVLPAGSPTDDLVVDSDSE